MIANVLTWRPTRARGVRLLPTALVLLISLAAASGLAAPRALQVGIAAHAFDHLGNLGDQAEAAAASGANIIYVTGLGGLGYAGLPDEQTLAQQRQATSIYLHRAHQHGIALAIGYVCATSMLNLQDFDRHWSLALRAQFHSPPAAWRQQDRQGHPLPSWYGGVYQPACMNNPDWRTYEHFMVRQQLEAGCDGIFFDNPTVHPHGCYCPYCMEGFARFLKQEGFQPAPAPGLEALRAFAAGHKAEFQRFRCTIARDFLADMRRYARHVKHGALITANNSFNAADRLYSQCQMYGYNIYQMSQAEDYVVVEDESSQPRTLPSGQTLEYGPSYQQLLAISHGRPVVAVTLAQDDYHTPPELMRLAMAEAAANGASYLSWPTWPEAQRARMSAAVRPEALFLRQHADLLNDTRPRHDVLLFLPFRDWVKTTNCKASALAAALSRANVQYGVICEDDLRLKRLREAQVLLAASPGEFRAKEQKVVEKYRAAGGRMLSAETATWLAELKGCLARPSVVVHGPSTVRVVVQDQGRRTLVHLLNLNVERLSSFEDRVTPVADLGLELRVPLRRVHSVRALTADTEGTAGSLKFSLRREGRYSVVQTTVPRVEIGTILVVE